MLFLFNHYGAEVHKRNKYVVHNSTQLTLLERDHPLGFDIQKKTLLSAGMKARLTLVILQIKLCGSKTSKH